MRKEPLNRGLRGACIFAAVCLSAVLLSGAAVDSQIKETENLLKKRAEIMDNVLYGKISYEAGAKALYDVECGTLYKNDLNSLNEYRNSDIDKVIDTDVTGLSRQSSIKDMETYRAVIEWTCEDTEGIYKVSDDYNVSVKETGGKARLVSIQPARND